MRRHDPVAAERREVEAVVEVLAVDDPARPTGWAERAGSGGRAAAASDSRSGSLGPGRAALRDHVHPSCRPATSSVPWPAVAASAGVASGRRSRASARRRSRDGDRPTVAAVGSGVAMTPATSPTAGDGRPARCSHRPRRPRRPGRRSPARAGADDRARDARARRAGAAASRAGRARATGTSGHRRCVSPRPHRCKRRAEWLHGIADYAYSPAHEPPSLLERLEEEALAALPGGTGPGALNGASDDEPGPPGNGGSRGRGTTTVTAAFRLPWHLSIRRPLTTTTQ